MTIKVGLIGGRSLSNILGFKLNPNTEVTAVCDLDEGFLKEVAEKHNIPNTFRVYQDMLASDIDAVVVSTPMQLHMHHVVQALEAGKHVMSEVPAAISMDELWWIIEAAEKSDKVYMMAENYVYIPEVQMVKNMVNQGVFGETYFAEGEYLHGVRHLTKYNDSDKGLWQGKDSWRKYWQLGIRGNFYPTHSLGPCMQFFPGDRIKSIICAGVENRFTDLSLRQEDTTITLCQMESGKLIKLRLDCISKRPHNMHYYTLQGTKGAYEAKRGMGDDSKVYIEGRDDGKGLEWRPLKDFYEEYMPEKYKKATEEQKETGHWGGDYFVVEDFIDAMVKGTKPPIDVYEAAEWTAVGLLSQLSVTNGGRVMEMPNFRKNMPWDEKRIKL